MASLKSNRRMAGAILLVAGMLLLAFGGAYLVRSQAEGAALREELRDSAPAAVEITATSALVAVVEASATPAQVKLEKPSATATRAVSRTATGVAATVRTTPRPTVTITPTATAEPSPTVTAVPVGVEPVRIVFPDLRIDTSVVPMSWRVVQTQSGPSSEWVIPRNEAGHHINSSKLGEPGNLVISGHNNIYAEVFKPISLAWDNDTRQMVNDYTDKSDLLNGRRIELYDAAGERYDYVVTAFYRLKDTGVPVAQRIANGRYAQQTQDTRLTIVTCWPPTNNTHRLILIAAPAPAQ